MMDERQNPKFSTSTRWFVVLAKFLRSGEITFALAITASAFAGLTALYYTAPHTPAHLQLSDVGAEWQKKDAALRDELKRVVDHLNSIENVLDASKGPQTQAATLLAIADMQGQVAAVSGRIKALEDAISASPEKALSIPLMHKDLESLQKALTDDRIAVSSDLARLYDFNKWFLGTIATMTLAVVSLALTNLFKASKPTEKEKAA